MAEKVRNSPAALARNQVEELVDSATAHPKESKQPPKKELMNILSIRMCAFFAPIRETSSVVCAGVNASMLLRDLIWQRTKYVRVIRF